MQLIDLWAQVHDAILFEYDEDKEDRIIPEVLSLMRVPLLVHGRIMIVPVEAKVGYDWNNMALYGSEKAKKLKRRSSNFLDRIL